MTNKYGFVYLWFDAKRKRFYIGSHWGLEDDGYVCSSNWMKSAYKKRPSSFKRKILEIVKDRTLIREVEHKWLSMIKDEELGFKYYNLRKDVFPHWSSDYNKKLTVSEKISKAKMGVPRTEAFKISMEKTLIHKKLMRLNLTEEETIEFLKKRVEAKILKEEAKILKEEAKILKEEAKILKEEAKILKEEEAKILKEEAKILKEEAKRIALLIEESLIYREHIPYPYKSCFHLMNN